MKTSSNITSDLRLLHFSKNECDPKNTRLKRGSMLITLYKIPSIGTFSMTRVRIETILASIAEHLEPPTNQMRLPVLRSELSLSRILCLILFDNNCFSRKFVSSKRVP